MSRSNFSVGNLVLGSDYMAGVSCNAAVDGWSSWSLIELDDRSWMMKVMIPGGKRSFKALGYLAVAGRP